MKRLEERHWWPELVALKDVMSLRELGERFGAAPAAIANALRRNDLDRQGAPPGPRASRNAEWRDAASKVIDAMSRAQSAAQTDAANDEAAFEDGATISTFARGYQATVGGRTFVIVAANIAEAARIAQTAAHGPVARIELLGDALAG